MQLRVHKDLYFKILCIGSRKAAVFVTCQHTNTGDQVTLSRLSSSLHKYIGSVLILCNDTELAVAFRDAPVKFVASKCRVCPGFLT